MKTHPDEFEKENGLKELKELGNNSDGSDKDIEGCSGMDLDRRKDLIKIFKEDEPEDIVKKFDEGRINPREMECAMARLELKDRNKYVEISIHLLKRGNSI